MKPFTTVTGRVLPLPRADVDTDQIIPARHLQRIERSGFGQFAFEAWRADPEFVLNDERRVGARILVAGPNFGCGSSREHAAWALEDLGIRVVLAPGFADIFRSNCAQIGLLAATMPAAVIDGLVARSQADATLELTVDLASQSVQVGGTDESFAFEIDPRVKQRLAAGRDAIAQTLTFEDAIATHEARRRVYPTTSEGASS